MDRPMDGQMDTLETMSFDTNESQPKHDTKKKSTKNTIDFCRDFFQASMFHSEAYRIHKLGSQ